ncbi:MAG: glycosyltransferase family 39 protein [bacterium]|nr:glycosyltransferase family 39 protein [bacterium]
MKNKISYNYIEENYKAMFGLISLLALLFYLSLIFSKSVWYDEAYTYALIEHSYSDICKITAADVHPPLYYILLKAFSMLFSDRMIAGKLFSVIPFWLAGIIGGLETRKIFNTKTSLIFLLVFFSFPALLRYVTEVRMYSLALLFVLINSIYAYRCYNNNTFFNWASFTVSGACAAYTHYFALVSVGVVYGMLLIRLLICKRKSLKYYIISCIVILLMYIPWLKSFSEQLAYKINNEYWIGPITLKTIVGYLYSLFCIPRFKLYCIIILMIYLLIFINIIRLGNKKNIIISVCAIAVPVLTVGVGIAVSLIVRPVFVIRYAIPAMSVFLIFAALGISQLNTKQAIAVLAVIFFGTGVNYLYTLMGDYILPNTIISSSFVAAHDNCEAYVVDIDNSSQLSHVRGVLSFWDDSKPIYNTGKISKANPFKNLMTMDDFDKSKINSFVLIIPEGENIPARYSDYIIEYQGTISILNAHAVDTYLLEKAQL